MVMGLENVHMILGNGIKIYVDFTSTRRWDLVLDNDGEKIVKDIFLQNIENGNCVIDCGANVGEFSLIAAKKIGPLGKVISIEPEKMNIIQLKENFLLNNFKILNMAVSDKSGTAEFYDHGVSGSSCLDPNLLGKPVTKTSTISVTTIDDVIDSLKINNIDMLKLDIEGYEYEAFLGCKKAFSKNKISKIVCEIHTRLLKKKGITEDMILQLLEKNNFEIKIINTQEGRVKHIFASNSKN